ncbi:MAG: ribosome assembly factor SBDS [Candidatus Aenigmatarchaeota archaeon]
MISIEKAVVARLKKGEQNFEILVDPQKAYELKQGKNIKIEEVLAVIDIFKDARKGERVSTQDLKKAFNTTDIYQVALEIIKKGEIQITTEMKRKMIEEKKNQIINLIHKRFIDPKTNAPHPIQRIQNALEQVKVNIDPFLDSEVQLENVLKELKKVLPLKLEYTILEIKIPLNVASKLHKELKKLQVLEEEWTENYLRIKVKIISATKNDLISLLYRHTNEIEIKEVAKE